MSEVAVVLSENSKRLEFPVTIGNFESLVRDTLAEIGESFLKLGYYFIEAQKQKLYIPLGYDSLFEMTEDLFDLKESSVYNMMGIWRFFHNEKDPLMLRSDCASLSYSQLVECLRDRRGGGAVTRVISSADTVQETKAKVTAWNNLFLKVGGYPSLEEVEREVECMELRKEREQAERESKRLEKSAPELVGQLEGQTSIFSEGLATVPLGEKVQTFGKIEDATSPIGAEEDEEPPVEDLQNSKRLEISEETEPFAGLPAETEIYAENLVKDMRAESDSIVPCEVVPSELQMRIHKNSVLDYVGIIEKAETKEGVERFFENAIKRLVAMRAYKLKELKEKGQCC